MSRPFSYNDENFTVIGNMLFIHIKITEDVEPKGNIVEIPKAIYDRLLYYSTMYLGVLAESRAAGAARLSGGINFADGRYYVAVTSQIDAATINYLVSCYCLKDI